MHGDMDTGTMGGTGMDMDKDMDTVDMHTYKRVCVDIVHSTFTCALQKFVPWHSSAWREREREGGKVGGCNYTFCISQ